MINVNPEVSKLSGDGNIEFMDRKTMVSKAASEKGLAFSGWFK